MGFQSTYTVNDVAASIKRTFGDESGVQVIDSDIIRWVNAAQIEIVNANKILKGSATTPSVVDQEGYQLGATLKILTINSIHYEGVKLGYKTFHDAEAYITSEDPTKVQRGTPEFWYEWAGEIFLYPIPSESGKSIKVYFLTTPDKVGAIGDPLSVPDNYYNRVVEFVMANAYEMDENLGAHQAKYAQFQDGMLNMSLQEEVVQVDTYSTITVMPEDQ